MNAVNVCSRSRWEGLCTRLTIDDSEDTYSKLLDAHAEAYRAYHTLEHIAACLQHLDKVRCNLERPDEVEMAFWFHDAVYQPFSGSNEEDSAQWARRWLLGHGVNKCVSARISNHILATKTHDRAGSLDQCYMLDIDLAILGSSPEVYKAFEANVRLEYKRVPRFLFRRKRKEILRGFLMRPEIYLTDHFRDKFEMQARANIAQAVASLS